MRDSRASGGRARPGWRHLTGWVGPGILAGASDADPTTVATLAIAGAGTTFGLAWLTLLLFPMIAVVQAISTQLGFVSGRDLAKAIVDRYGPAPRWALLSSIVAVNMVTIAADLEGGAAAAGLLLHVDWRWFVAPLSIVSLLTALALNGYRRMQRASLLLLPFVLAYAGAVVLSHPRWSAVVAGSLIPHLEWTNEYLSDSLSLVGTTLTSYVYVWQSIAHSDGLAPPSPLRSRQLDSLAGSFFAVAVFWLVLVATGGTLGVEHASVETAGEAARALRPIAGPLAGDLFAVGLLLSSIVALPVIIATTAYVTGAQMKWRRGLSLQVTEAPRFYGVLAGAALLGVVLAFSGISPIRLLFLAGIVGGIATPLGLVALLLLAGDRRLMRGQPVSPLLLIAGWLAAAAITALGLVFLVLQVGQALIGYHGLS